MRSALMLAVALAVCQTATALAAPATARPETAAPGVPSYQPPTIESPDPWGTAGRVAVALAVVLTLVVGSQRALARAGAMRDGGGAIRVREIRRLGPQQALYVVDAGGRRLLLGSHVSLVADLGPADEPQTQTPFAQRLRALGDRLGQFTERAGPDGDPPARRPSPPRGGAR